MDRDSLTLLLARGMSVERIAHRFNRHPSTISYWMAKYGLEAPNHDKHAAKGGIARERLEALVEEGRSIGEMAEELGLSKGTVRHWLARYELRTVQARSREQRRDSVAEAIGAAEAPPREIRLTCPLHGETEFVREGSGYYRCGSCRSESVSRHRRQLKAMLVAEAGGCCVICGYDRLPRALEFHHVDPADKAFNLSRRGVTLSVEALRAEARKCVLLCSNCHAEVESGALTLPVK
jgi:transposase